VKSTAKAIYPTYASAIDSGQNMTQAMSFWISRFQAELELGYVNPSQEPILIRAAMTPGLQYSTFDTWVRQDPRWEYTSQARNEVAKLASSILCAFGFGTCSK
jgi:hypothetical protein